MASPAGADMANGISTPPATSNAQSQSSPTAPNPQPSSQSQSQPQVNGHAHTNGPPAPPSHPLTSLQDDGKSKRPRDARLIHIILQNMGVHAYTERVPLQLLDFAYRYTSGIMSDAIAYEPPAPAPTTSKRAAAHKDDEGVSLNAIRTAVASRAAQQFSTALPKEFMAEVAAERNRVALPRVEREFGVRLPPERYCFTGVGWGVRESWENDDVQEEEEELGVGGEGVGGPVGGLSAAADTMMGGMMEEEEEVDEDEFEEVMGKGDTTMVDG